MSEHTNPEHTNAEDLDHTKYVDASGYRDRLTADVERVLDAQRTERAEIAAGLREWAKGIYALEAAVELLVRFNHGRLLSGMWIERTASRCWFAADMVPNESGLSGGERRVLMLAASLVKPDTVRVDLGDVASGVDRDALDLVLAATAHAGGSHEHSRPVFGLDGTYGGSRRLSSLHPWPNTTTDTTEKGSIQS